MKLNLGSGKVKLKGWFNVDLNSPEADLHLDLRKKLPFDDESIEYIYNEHFIEHISREEALSLLKECYRVLIKNGVLRLSTPNLKFLVLSYLSRNISQWGDLWRPTNPCRLINEGMRYWGHQFIYDAEELTRILSEAGFPKLSFVVWRESAFNELAGLETRPFNNELIVEASKFNHFDVSLDVKVESDENEPWMISVQKMLCSHGITNVQKMILHQTKHMDQIIADQSKYITGLEQTIADQSKHLTGLEQTIADQSKHLTGLEQTIADQSKHITGLEKTIADQTTHIRNVEADWTARGQHISNLEEAIADQANHINNIEAELKKFHSSWYGRLQSAKKKLHHLKN